MWIYVENGSSSKVSIDTRVKADEAPGWEKRGNVSRWESKLENGKSGQEPSEEAATCRRVHGWAWA